MINLFRLARVEEWPAFDMIVWADHVVAAALLGKTSAQMTAEAMHTFHRGPKDEVGWHRHRRRMGTVNEPPND